MVVYTNTSRQTRTWTTLTNPATGRTLTLPPDGEIELPAGFTDPYLKPKSPTKKSAARKPSTTQPSPAGEQNEEE